MNDNETSKIIHEIESLRLQIDKKSLVINNSKQKMIIPSSLLKKKGKVQSEIYQLVAIFKYNRQAQHKKNLYLQQYEKFIQNQLESMTQNQDNITFKLDQQIQVMRQNLQGQINYWRKILTQYEMKNNKQINSLKKKIVNIRCNIKQKQQTLIKIKQQLWQLYIYQHKTPNSFHNKKSNNKPNHSQERKPLSSQKILKQSKYIGDIETQKHAEEIIDQLSEQHPLIAIRYQMDKKQNIIFHCIYQGREGKIHTNNKSKIKQSKWQLINIKQIITLKIFKKFKIVGMMIECRNINENGKKIISIGNCSYNLDFNSINLIKKKLLSLSSYWYQNTMIGICIWFKNINNVDSSQKKYYTKRRQISSDKILTHGIAIEQENSRRINNEYFQY